MKDKSKKKDVNSSERIPNGWKLIKLKYLTKKIQTGTTPPSGNEEYFDGNINWFTPADLDHSFILKSSKRKITELAVKDNVVKLFEVNSVLLVSIGNLGKVGVLAEKSSCNQQLNAITFNTKIFPLYGAYYLSSITQYIYSFANITLLSILNQFQTGEIKILLPPLPIQKKIADFLDKETSHIDRLISTKEHFIELLEEKRKSVISESVTRGIGNKVKLKDSGIKWLGKIPKHWQVKKLKFLTKDGLVNGIFKKSEDFGSGTLLVNVSDVYSQNYIVNIENLERVEVTQNEIENFKVKKGDIFFVRSSLKKEGIAQSAYIDNIKENIVFECHLIKISLNNLHVMPSYLIFFLNSTICRERLISLSITTTMTTIGQMDIGNLEIPLPPLDEQEKIVNYLKRILEKTDNLISKTKKSIELLKEKRTALISEVVIGKREVK